MHIRESFQQLYHLNNFQAVNKFYNFNLNTLLIFIRANIYVMEFKTESENALQQIKQMKYYEKFQNQTSKQNKEIYLVGINFDKQKKNISAYEWEKL